jgi:hypothetical protein
VPLPDVPGAHAIWGATGQDARGHIWLGVTTDGISPNSAHLFEHIPETGEFIDRGNVVAELERAGLRRAGEQQAKIHSRIIPGPDNYLYFASMDEDGERADGSKLPTWGGHLWRMNLSTYRWEHLLRTPEALIAVGGGDRLIYALGYFGHVLYQYDTRTGRTSRVEVGSVDGHISRNVLVDRRGHAYVPRVSVEPGVQGAARQIRVTLVELDATLHEVHQTPIDTSHYMGSTRPTEAHGIIGLQMMQDGSILFTTHVGRLLRVVPPDTGANAADLVDLTWVHPGGTSYAPSLFTADAATSLSSLAKRRGAGWEWVACTWPALTCDVTSIEIAGLAPAAINRSLLYGSSTRDSTGGHYVVGMGNGYRPMVLRIR